MAETLSAFMPGREAPGDDRLDSVNESISAWDVTVNFDHSSGTR